MPQSATKPDKASAATRSKPKRGLVRRVFRWLGWSLLLLFASALIARPFLPRVVRWYVNRTLDQSVLYRGKIGDVQLHLWRGAYSIHDVRIMKTTGDIPVPFFSAKEVDLSVERNALLHGKIVGRVLMVRPEVNFVDDPEEAKSETGSGGPWLKILSDLFPFDLNSVRVEEGSIHFRTYQKEKPVDVYMSHLNASVDDLTNVRHSLTPLLTSVHATAMAMDDARFEMQVRLDPFSYYPTFHVAVRLLGLDITKTNDLILTYGGFDVKRGSFDLVLDIDVKEGVANGYVKPLFRNMVIFDPIKDIKEDQNVVQVFWQALVGGSAAIVTNYNRDQLGTLIPVTGQLQKPHIDILGTIGNMLRNAFIRAYLPRLEKNAPRTDELEFGPPSIADPVSIGSEP